MGLKTGRKLSSRCSWCKSWEVYECGYSHHGIVGKLNCEQCGNTGRFCTDSGHPSRKEIWQI